MPRFRNTPSGKLVRSRLSDSARIRTQALSMQRRSLQPVLLSVVLCAMPWIAVARPTSWLVANAQAAGFLKPLPFFLLIGLAFLGVKLNQTRLFFVGLFLTFAYAYLQVQAPSPWFAGDPWGRTQ